MLNWNCSDAGECLLLLTDEWSFYQPGFVEERFVSRICPRIEGSIVYWHTGNTRLFLKFDSNMLKAEVEHIVVPDHYGRLADVYILKLRLVGLLTDCSLAMNFILERQDGACEPSQV